MTPQVGGRGPGRLPFVVGAVACAAAVGWSWLAAAVSGRGLGQGNEGFYLLSYEYWDQDPHTFTGAQYEFGPVFTLLGGDIGSLRLVRLAAVIAVHVFFGLSFARWLRLGRPRVRVGRAWEFCIVGLVVASGAILYAWLPPTPGYNDVTLLGSMVMVGLLLVVLRATGRGERPPASAGAVWGFVAAAMVLAKPPVIVPVLVIAAVSGYAVRRSGGGLARVAAGTAGGALAFALVIQLAVMPWADLLPPLFDELRTVSGSSHSPVDLASWYVESSLVLGRASLVVCAPAVLAAVALRALGRRGTAWRTPLLLLGLAGSIALLATVGGLRAGSGNVLAFTSGITAMLGIVLATGASAADVRHRPTPATASVTGLLLLVPVLQGLGTNNAIYAIAVNGTGFWVALMIVVVTRLEPDDGPRFALAGAATVSAVALAAVVGARGVAHDASGHRLVAAPMARVEGSTDLSTIVLPAAEAERLSALRADLGITPGSHRPMLAFGELAHYVLVLGGRPIGSAWFAGDDDGLNAADLRRACRHGNPWGATQPLVVASRSLSAAELAAWRRCGVDFARDYRDVTPGSAPSGIRVLRSARDAAATGP